MGDHAIINGMEIAVRNGGELLAAVHRHENTQFLEVWADHGTESMCMLANADRAWLMYVRNQDEECFSTRNPDIPNDGRQLEFYLSNGQKDAYPSHWTVRRELARQGLAFLFDHGGRTPDLDWHDDNMTYGGEPDGGADVTVAPPHTSASERER